MRKRKNKEEKRKVCQQLGLYRTKRIRLYISLPPRAPHHCDDVLRGTPPKEARKEYV